MGIAKSSVASLRSQPKTTVKKVAVLGFGNIGAGVVDMLYRGIPGLELSKVVVKDKNKKRHITIPSSYITTDINQVIEDPEMDVVVEVMGGVDPTKDIILNALRNGKD